MTESVTLSNQEDVITHQSVLQKIEDEYDLKAYEEAKAEFKKDPKTYTFGDIKAEFGTLKVVKNPESRQ